MPTKRAASGIAATTLSAAVLLPAALAAPARAAATDDVWDRVARCESGGDWAVDTHNGYFGGLQFALGSWLAAGGGRYAPSPDRATKAQQIAIAQVLLRMQGPGAWPVCGPRAGLQTADASRPPAGATQPGDAVPASPPKVVKPGPKPAPGAPKPAPAAPNPVHTAPKPAPSAPKPAPSVPKPVLTMPKPGPTTPKSGPTTSKPAPTTSKPAPLGKTYQVRPGDTLSGIAQKLHVTGGWQTLYAANRATIADPGQIFPGQTVRY